MTQLLDSQEHLERFLQQEDLSVLADKPIVFSKTRKFNQLQLCCGWTNCIASLGISMFCNPIATCAPGVMYPEYQLTLDAHSVKYSNAYNDCCCHVATSQKVVPLEKIQDVELQESWYQTCFGLKQVNVQTAGQGGMGAEVEAVFLAAPEAARDAIQLAAKLHREAATTAPGTLAMARAAEQGTLLHRLQCLESLVARGVLNADEAAALRVPVLTAEKDPLGRLREAADLAGSQVISPEELAAVKAALLAAIQHAGAAGSSSMTHL